jgi:Zn-dependent peptidase ImmA (M78 family)/transcriptional regulator with XRE-family HTH domain
MPDRVRVRSTLLEWAADRAGLDDDEVARRFPSFSAWVAGDRRPTFRQLEGFAKAVHAPLGYFFLDEPPEEPVPIRDFRTFRDEQVRRPSPDLLDTIYLCQARQEWYREHALWEGSGPVAIVGSVSTVDPIHEVAWSIASALRFRVEDRSAYASWEIARRRLIDAVEDLGVLVMVSGIVGNSTHRRLDPQEFRGFALADPLAPVIFVNGADTKASQIFTLVHELAHIAAGQTGLSDVALTDHDGQADERWANEVAAEVLLPLSSLHEHYRQPPDVVELERLARMFEVSTLVVVKRIFDAGLLGWDEYRSLYDAEHERIVGILGRRDDGASGGDWHKTQPLRVSRTFARAVTADAFEGRTLFRDAYALVGAARHETFEHLAAEVGVR